MEYSKIEWTDHTFNPWIGCQHISPGCDHCYAEAMMDTRYGKVDWGPHGERKRTSDANWRQPVKWNADARAFKKKHNRRLRVFAPLWLTCSIIEAENQFYFDQRWPILEAIPAALKFISYEPVLGPLRLPIKGTLPDWIISGGESGAGARKLKPRWIRNIIKDCQDRDVAIFHKQWGTYQNNPLVVEQGLTRREAKAIDDFGKGGGLVNGVLVREFPQQGHDLDSELKFW